MAIGIGTRVRVTHKPEHDNVNLGRFMSFRSTSTGKIGFVEGHSPDGDLLVGIDGAGATWWHPDEVTAAPLFAETCESLRDELANEKAAHAEAERLLSAERAALEVSRAKVLDLEMRAVEAERLLTAASRAAGEIIEARDRLSRVKAAVDALRAAIGHLSVDEITRLHPFVEAVDRALAGIASASLTSAEAHALWQRMLRDRPKDDPLTVDERAVALLLRVSRDDFGEAPREPATDQPRTDLAALADAIEASGRTWQRVEPSTLAKALRVTERRMRTLEAAVTALAASVEQVQAGIGAKLSPTLTEEEAAAFDRQQARMRAFEQDEKPASPQQGDGSGRLVLGHIDGQPIRARYTGVTPTEPRKP